MSEQRIHPEGLISAMEFSKYEKMFDNVSNKVPEEERKRIAKIIRKHMKVQTEREEELDFLRKDVYRYRSSDCCKNLLERISHRYRRGEVVVVRDSDCLRIGKITKVLPYRNYEIALGGWQRGLYTNNKVHEKAIVCLASNYKIPFPDAPGVFDKEE